MARQTKKLTECVSCGGEADPNSERNFCTECDKQFEAGLVRQGEIEARAAALGEAQEAGDDKTVGKLMTEIFQTGVAGGGQFGKVK